MSKEPDFSVTTCQNEHEPYCSRVNHTKLVQKGEGYKLICPRCGWVHDPEKGMTYAEKNQHIINNTGPNRIALANSSEIHLIETDDKKLEGSKKTIWFRNYHQNRIKEMEDEMPSTWNYDKDTPEDEALQVKFNNTINFYRDIGWLREKTL